MSRFESHQRNQFTSKIIIFSVILIVVVYFVLTIGFKLLFDASVFIANLTAKNTPQPLTKNTDIYGTVSIDSIPVATNSAQFYISGSVTNFNIIDFYLNGTKVKSITLDSSDSFNEQIGDLEKDDNQVYVIARSSDSTSEKTSTTYDVLYKPDKPKLDISSPSDNSTTSDQSIAIKGSTDKETIIKVQGIPAVVDANGDFESDVKLNDGNNTITITATDVAGNLETKTLTVKYQKD